MKKRVFIIHGWGDYPQNDWFPWVKRELEERSFEVVVPAMPNPNEPRIDAWVSYISEVVGGPDGQTFFIGHSIGCQTIMRYLGGLPIDKKVGGVVFVAGWFVLSDLETEEEKVIGKPWIETPIDFDHVRKMAGNFTVILGEDDPVVPYEENRKLFEARLDPKIIVENGRGHFSGSDGVTELPSVLDAVLEMVGS